MKKPKRPAKAAKKAPAQPVENKPVEQVTAKPENEPIEWDYFAPPYGYRRTR